MSGNYPSIVVSGMKDGFTPSSVLERCCVCGSGVMHTSPDGVTCGLTACREELIDKIRELSSERGRKTREGCGEGSTGREGGAKEEAQ